MPWATTSHFMMPPKMLTRSALTCLSDVNSLNACTTYKEARATGQRPAQSQSCKYRFAQPVTLKFLLSIPALKVPGYQDAWLLLSSPKGMPCHMQWYMQNACNCSMLYEVAVCMKEGRQEGQQAVRLQRTKEVASTWSTSENPSQLHLRAIAPQSGQALG